MGIINLSLDEKMMKKAAEVLKEWKERNDVVTDRDSPNARIISVRIKPQIVGTDGYNCGMKIRWEREFPDDPDLIMASKRTDFISFYVPFDY